jgi:hypothetical protein
MRIVATLPIGALVQETPNPYVEIIAADARHARLRLHGSGAAAFRFVPARGEPSALLDGSVVTRNAGESGPLNLHVSWEDTTQRECVLTVEGLRSLA